MATSSPKVTIFSTIRDIGPAFRKRIAESNHKDLNIREVQDDALHNAKDRGTPFHPEKLAATTKQQLHETEILIAEPATLAAIFQHTPDVMSNLKWCQSTFAGVDPMFQKGLTMPLPFVLTRFSGTFGQPIAEWCLARIIAHERRFDISQHDQKTKSWIGGGNLVTNYRYLNELTLVVLGGCGDIGQCIAKAAKYAFGMKTIAYARSIRRKDDLPDGVDQCINNLSGALREADYIVSVLPSTPGTKGLLSGDAFAAASKSNGGKSPVFLNVGRGDVTDEKSLLAALDRGYLSGAILDVFEVEPLLPSSPLWGRDDVIISPHVSGLTKGHDVPELFLENYHRYLSGEDLRYAVDWDKGY